MRIRTVLVACSIVSLTLILEPRFSAAQTSDCSAHVNVTQTSRDQDSFGATFKYRIDATSDADSSVVHFKIRRTYEVNGTHYSEAEPWSITVLGGHATDTGELRESSSPRQIQWSVEDVFCKKTADSASGTGSNNTAPASSEDIDATLLGTWRGPCRIYFYKPRGQVEEGTLTETIERKTGPLTYEGKEAFKYTRTASPGHRFMDDSTVQEGNETDLPRIYKFTGSSLEVTDPGDGIMFMVLELSGHTLSETNAPNRNPKTPGERTTTLTKQ
jgi:hypothetical protein